MSEVHRCSVCVYSGSSYSGHMCANPAKSKEDDRWYCGIHLPSVVHAKRAARHAKWAAEFNARTERDKAAEAAASEQKRRADLYPELLALLQDIDAAYESIRPFDDLPEIPAGEHDPYQVFRKVRALTAKATNSQGST